MTTDVAIQPAAESPDPVLEAALATRGLACAARVTRHIGASLARIWENVLDWEHLPWLHAEAFEAIELVSASALGWRAHVRGRGSTTWSVIEVQIERDALRYVSVTREGAGASAEIWTWLSPEGTDATRVDQAFWLPKTDEARLRRRGVALLALYDVLWAQDEMMMRDREAELRALRGARRHAVRVSLGSLDALRARLPASTTAGGRRFRVMAVGAELVAVAARCPHRLGPLDDAACEGGELVCPWHGYRFDARTGRSTDGHGLRLETARVEIDPETRDVQLIVEPRSAR
jgi:nitrite reductase/ring-hydroxylating ferredoxin subunit